MWSLLSRKLQVTVIVGAGVLIAWALDDIWAFLRSGEHAGPLKWISLTATIVGTFIATAAELFWRRLWAAFPMLQRLTFPDVNGSWKGTLASTWIDPNTGMLQGAINVEIAIRQGLFTTSVSLKTAESKSFSTHASLEPFYTRRLFRIWYRYTNEPNAVFQDRSNQHEGVAFLDLDYDADMNRLTGRYYTARKTTGDIDVRRAN